MLTFFKRRKYKNDVRLSMSYLLGLDTQGYTSHDVLRLYPKVRASLDTDFGKRHLLPIEAAATVLTIKHLPTKLSTTSRTKSMDGWNATLSITRASRKFAIEMRYQDFHCTGNDEEGFGPTSRTSPTNHMLTEIITSIAWNRSELTDPREGSSRQY